MESKVHWLRNGARVPESDVKQCFAENTDFHFLPYMVSEFFVQLNSWLADGYSLDDLVHQGAIYRLMSLDVTLEHQLDYVLHQIGIYFVVRGLSAMMSCGYTIEVEALASEMGIS